jgi:hypothetical protein
MDFVSVNVSREDAALLLRVVEAGLAACGCAGEGNARRCERCDALAAIRAELRGMLTSRRRPLPTRPAIVAAEAGRLDRAAVDQLWAGPAPTVC